jgi:glyoxylase-like metal-dependent hydrolase (beta-lactamase superfamily II)
MRKMYRNPWTPLNALRAATLGLALASAGCEGERGPKGNPGEPGESATIDPSLSAMDKAFVGIGGKESIQAMKSFELELTGLRHVAGEGFTPETVGLAHTFDGTRVSYDLENNRISINHKRTIKFLGFTLPQDYTEIINGNKGYVNGIESIFGFPTGNLSPDRTAAVRRQLRLTNPHLILKDVAADANIARDGGAALFDGSLHNLLVVNDPVYPLTLYVNAQTGRISKLVTLENDHLHRDIPVEVFYSGWEPTTEGGPLFPKQVYVAANGHLLLQETRKVVTPNPSLAATLFAFPAEANPSDDAASVARGTQNHQFHMSFASIGIPTDGLLTDVVPTMVAPGVFFLGGSFHNSVAVEQASGIVILEAPLYPERGTAIINWAKTQFPSKSITHVLATHHHDDHAGGLRAFVAAGAKVVVHEDTAAHFRRVFTNPSTIRVDPLQEKPTAATILTVPHGGSLPLPDATNPVTAYSFNTVHAKDMLMFYVGGAKLVFSSDLYNPGQGGIGNGPKELYTAIQARALDVTTVAGGHGATGPISALAEAAGP